MPYGVNPTERSNPRHFVNHGSRGRDVARLAKCQLALFSYNEKRTEYRALSRSGSAAEKPKSLRPHTRRSAPNDLGVQPTCVRPPGSDPIDTASASARSRASSPWLAPTSSQSDSPAHSCGEPATGRFTDLAPRYRGSEFPKTGTATDGRSPTRALAIRSQTSQVDPDDINFQPCVK